MKIHDSRGFTLIEVTIAVMIFTIAVLGLLGVTAGITRLLANGDRVATASFYAEERLENMRATDCATLAAGSETRGGVYDLQWSVTSVFGGNARSVQLLVSYPSFSGATRVDTLGTTLSCVV